jgi:hypothetical protein
MDWSPLSPPELPFGLKRKDPNGNSTSSAQLKNLWLKVIVVHNALTDLPLKFIKVIGFIRQIFSFRFFHTQFEHRNPQGYGKFILFRHRSTTLYPIL